MWQGQRSTQPLDHRIRIGQLLDGRPCAQLELELCAACMHPVSLRLGFARGEACSPELLDSTLLELACRSMRLVSLALGLLDLPEQRTFVGCAPRSESILPSDQIITLTQFLRQLACYCSLFV